MRLSIVSIIAQTESFIQLCPLMLQKAMAEKFLDCWICEPLHLKSHCPCVHLRSSLKQINPVIWTEQKKNLLSCSCDHEKTGKIVIIDSPGVIRFTYDVQCFPSKEINSRDAASYACSWMHHPGWALLQCLWARRRTALFYWQPTLKNHLLQNINEGGCALDENRAMLLSILRLFTVETAALTVGLQTVSFSFQGGPPIPTRSK